MPALLYGCGHLRMPPRARARLLALREWLPGGLTVNDVDEKLRTIAAVKTSDKRKAATMLLQLRSQVMHALFVEGSGAVAQLRSARHKARLLPFTDADKLEGHVCIGRGDHGQKRWVAVTDAARAMMTAPASVRRGVCE